jgi:hypothetical protein
VPHARDVHHTHTRWCGRVSDASRTGRVPGRGRAGDDDPLIQTEVGLNDPFLQLAQVSYARSELYDLSC